ncbi:copper amine oxidase N-terminal domain-containing protein [Paenibacillus athensensis]|uniref:Copper amine oxidase-like N-terminal domain-containing protein n=1 Tax=Paenibacillus athensensis TaxID=1967502 RepID=A0A4Y8PYD3_9BACL|nr:copper amine oxidase N-terminal domain-containing protein [Paenibacillus athensensis]MCD1259934.1 copper amine oxidase N-terminal domain-containing protein [Paenibacillus athensensis]
MKRLSQKWIIALLALTLLLPTLVSAHTIGVQSSASDLRSTLERLLGEHGLLAVIAMQKGIDNAPDFKDAAAALTQNGDDLSAAVGSVYGEDAGKAFNGLWTTHIGFFVDYVTATAKHDEAGRQAALDKLEAYGPEFGAFLHGANPNLPEDAIAAGLKEHVGQLIGAFDSYVNKDYPTAYAKTREAYAHMVHFGQVLADAIVMQFPDKFSQQGSSMAAADLRSAVDRLLGEHGLLAVLAMQKGIDGAADFNDAAAALAANTDDLTAAIASVYGNDAGTAFKGLWNAHIGFFVDVVTATAAKDEMKRKAALDKLDGYGTDFGGFLEGANPEHFKMADIAAALKPHVAQLIGAFDSYVNKDYPAAYSSIREAYTHMFHTGDYLSAGIVAQFQSKFHDAAAQPMTKLWLQIGSSSLKVNDQTTMMDTAPFIWEGNAYVPLRFLSEAIGATVTWEQATQSVEVQSGSDTLKFRIGQSDVDVNGMKQAIGMNVVLKDGRTQVPLRFIAELLGWNVQWNDSDWSIMLTKHMMPAAAHSH